MLELHGWIANCLAVVLQAATPPATAPVPPAPAPIVLPAGTPVIVALNEDLTSVKNMVGDPFQVHLVADVMSGTTVVIPKGAIGHGQVTFVSRRGNFGKGGFIGISLRDLAFGDRTVALAGHYREEGNNRDGTASATMFMVGIFAGAVKGGSATIPKGRELKARTGAEISIAPAPQPVTKGEQE